MHMKIYLKVRIEAVKIKNDLSGSNKIGYMRCMN